MIVSLLLSATSCGDKDSHAGHDHATEDNHDGHDHDHDDRGHGDDIIVVTPEQEKMLGVEKVKVAPQAFHQVIKCSGEILPAQGDEKRS